MTTKATPKTGPKGIPSPKAKSPAATVAETSLTAAAPEADMAADSDSATVTALKLRELVGRVVDATGGKKKGVKEIVEATLDQLGAALAKGEELNLPGVGKVRVARTNDRDGRTMMTLKVRGNLPQKPKEALAAAGEDV